MPQDKKAAPSGGQPTGSAGTSTTGTDQTSAPQAPKDRATARAEIQATLKRRGFSAEEVEGLTSELENIVWGS